MELRFPLGQVALKLGQRAVFEFSHPVEVVVALGLFNSASGLLNGFLNTAQLTDTALLHLPPGSQRRRLGLTIRQLLFQLLQPSLRGLVRLLA